MHVAAIAVALAWFGQSAIAAPADQPVSPPAHEDTRDPRSAIWQSAGATVAGVALFGGGLAARSVNEAAGSATTAFGATLLVFGPSAGRDYADDPAPWWPLRLRLAGAGLAVVASFTALGECGDLDPCPGHPKANVMFGVAGGLIAIGAVWDIATTGDAARRYNRRHRPSVTLAPQAGPDGGGLSLAGSF